MSAWGLWATGGCEGVPCVGVWGVGFREYGILESGQHNFEFLKFKTPINIILKVYSKNKQTTSVASSFAQRPDILLEAKSYSSEF